MLRQRLIFRNGSFLPGENVTIRNGTKWFNTLSPGHQLEAWVMGANPRVVALLTITDTQLSKICDLPENVLSREQDPVRRTHKGLMNLFTFRSRKKVSPRDKVSVIKFTATVKSGRINSEGAN